MNLFEFDDYRAYIRSRLKQMPRGGRGQVNQIADALGVHGTLVSQVLNGAKDFTLEQGEALTRYLGLVGVEIEYFLTLIQRERAGTVALRRIFDTRLATLKRESLKLSKRVTRDRELSESEKAQFYSDWIYSAIRLMTDIPGYQTRDRLNEVFDLDPSRVATVLQFLVRTGLLIETADGYAVGVQRTFLEQDSPFVRQHHANWRLRAIDRASDLSGDEMMFTCPVALSEQDFAQFREELAQLIKKFYERVKTSPSERLACLNIDWIIAAKL